MIGIRMLLAGLDALDTPPEQTAFIGRKAGQLSLKVPDENRVKVLADQLIGAAHEEGRPVTAEQALTVAVMVLACSLVANKGLHGEGVSDRLAPWFSEDCPPDLWVQSFETDKEKRNYGPLNVIKQRLRLHTSISLRHWRAVLELNPERLWHVGITDVLKERQDAAEV